MALNFTRWRNTTTGKPVAKARVEYVVNRDDLVEAAKQAMADTLPHDPERLAVTLAAKRLTKAKVEKTLSDMLLSYGGMWLESDSEDYLPVTPDVRPLLREYAEIRIRALYPELS